MRKYAVRIRRYAHFVGGSDAFLPRRRRIEARRPELSPAWHNVIVEIRSQPGGVGGERQGLLMHMGRCGLRRSTDVTPGDRAYDLTER